MPEISPERFAIAALVVILLVQSARLVHTRGRASRRLALHRERGARGERSAESILARAGFRIESRQPTADIAYVANGAPCVFDVRADLLVRRGEERAIVEVKTGDQATSLTNRATRRQLLEYAHAFDVRSVLLLDADRGTITHVEVPERTQIESRAKIAWWSIAFGMALGIALTLAASATDMHPPSWKDARTLISSMR